MVASASAAALPSTVLSNGETHVCRVMSDCLLDGFGQLDMQHIAQQLTSLSMALRCTTAEAQWQADATMLATLAQLSELRHLDVGNCLFLPPYGARRSAAQTILVMCQVFRQNSDEMFRSQHRHIELSSDANHLACTQGPLPVLSCQCCVS